MSSIGDLIDSSDPSTSNLFSWERTITRSWDELQLDQYGQLEYHKLQLTKQIQQKHKLDDKYNNNNNVLNNLIEKGMIRYLYVIIDCTESMNITDIKPNRKLCVLELLKLFIVEYFDQNPLSQLGIITTHNSIAYKLSELSGSPQQQIMKLHDYIENGIIDSDQSSNVSAATSGGEMSIQNSLLVAERTLQQLPSYGSREILFIHSSLHSVDPSDIYKTIDSIVTKQITVNIISLTAEMYIMTLLAQRTSGTFHVILNKSHLKELLLNYIIPSPLIKQRIKQLQRRWIKIGFPSQLIDIYPTLCTCHQLLKYGGYICPKCKCKYCELPCECMVCNTTLILSPHLARTYHHLFPTVPYQLLDKHNELLKQNNMNSNSMNNTYISNNLIVSTTIHTNDTASNGTGTSTDDDSALQWPNTQCYSCMCELSCNSSIRNRCPKCMNIYCIDCDEYIHTSLHNCPGCMSSIQTEQTDTVHSNTNMDVT